MTLRGSSPATLPDSDDLLWEILLRLPPQPSSLLRASAVCKQWRRLVTDPLFLDRFRAHHPEPPLLGVFEYQMFKFRYLFRPLMHSPDRIPPERFQLGRRSVLKSSDVLGCRHGRVLVLDHVQQEIVVCTPITGEQLRLAVPPDFKQLDFKRLKGTVLCAASAQGHVHGACHSSPFKVVMLSRKENLLFARVYSSATGVWGNLVSWATPGQISLTGIPATLVGNALCWQLLPKATRGGILQFDLEKESLAVIKAPPVNKVDFHHCQIIQIEDGALGLATLSYPRFQIWQRSVDGHHGVDTWVLWKTVDMHNFLGLPPEMERRKRGSETILGYSENIDGIFIHVDIHVYMIQLKSMEFKRLYKTYQTFDFHPFTSFYTPGASIAS